MAKVFHLLPEGESFSEFHGGAISRWVANVLRGDADGVVACPGADASWGLPLERVMILRWLPLYRKLLHAVRHRMPWAVRGRLLRLVCRPRLTAARQGDVVWVHNRPEFAAALCEPLRKAGAQVVLHMHNVHLLTAHAEILHALNVARIVYVSRYLENASRPALVRQVPSEVLYNGADARLFRPQRRDVATGRAMKVLFASRVVREKGAHLLAEALRRLKQANIAIEGVVVGGVAFGGSKPDRYVEELMRDAPPNLTFHPYCAGAELAQLFAEADVFCLPSVWQDPFPLAPLEAMAAGLPVVASRSGGIPEALFDGGGILVERNSVESLTAALRELALDPSLRCTLSEQALRSFERHFRWEHVQQNYRAILGRVADA